MNLTGTTAYERGVRAARRGVAVGDTPYHCTTNEHWLWMQGWGDERIRMKLSFVDTTTHGHKNKTA